MKIQQLVIYWHHENKLFFVSQINEDRVDQEATVERQYSRAKSIHKNIISSKLNESASGFMFAIINTDYSGWEVEITDTVAPNGIEGATIKQTLINQLLEENPDYKYVGSERIIAKGSNKGIGDHTWSRKFNISSMNKNKISERINFIMNALKEEIPQNIKNDAYFAITMPDRYGPKQKNFGSYQVDSLATLFLFIRNSLGYDLP